MSISNKPPLWPNRSSGHTRAVLCRSNRWLIFAENVLGQEFTIGYGQEVTLEDEGLSVRFASLASDSRCPSDSTVKCIWEGYAEIVVRLSKGGEDAASVELYTPNSRQETYPSESAYLDYTVKLVALDPKPKTAGSTEAAEYVATLLITRR